jgi:serine/threonine-protein kinase RsbW
VAAIMMDKAGSKRRLRGGRSDSHRSGPKGQSHFLFTIPSDYGASREVQMKIIDDVERHGFHQQALFAIRLALEEAMRNAIKHGNQHDRNKKVHVEAIVTPGEARILIEDEGRGFRRSRVPDPTLPKNLEKCSGRGILLIEAYMNEVKWSRGGRRLEMVKRNEPDLIPRG